MKRTLATLVSLFLVPCLTLGPGCSYAKITRGDVATEGAKYGQRPLPLTVAVAAFEDRTGGDIEPDTLFAVSKSWLTVLDKTGIFKNVYTDVEAPEADVKFQGSVYKCQVYENNWWLASWIVIGVATFGIFPALGAVFGLPYNTENGAIRVEVRAVDGKTGAPIASYPTDWSLTLVYNIYNTSSTRERSIYERPGRAMQAAMGESITAVVADQAKYAAVAAGKTGTGTSTGAGAAPQK